MKRLIALLLAAACIAVAAGCSAKEPVGDPPASNGNAVVQPESDAPAPVNAGAEKADWGLTLSARDVAPTGMTLVCSQSGGAPTGELQCGSDYSLLVYSNGNWNAVPYLLDEVAWDAIAYLVPMGGSVEFELDWEWLYGELPEGTYRLVKSFMDFREAGDYDTETYHADFEIAD